MRSTYSSIVAHEAGHTTVAWFCWSLILVDAKIYADQQLRGGIVHALTPSDPQPEFLWNRLLLCIGGITGQFQAGYTTLAMEAEGDLEQALKLSREIVLQLMHRGQSPLEAFPFNVKERDTIVRMFHRGTIDEQISPPVRHMLEAAFVKSRSILRAYRGEFLAIRVALALRRYLSEADVVAIIGPSPNSRLARRSFLDHLKVRAATTIRLVLWLIFSSPAKTVGSVEQNVATLDSKNVSHGSSSSSSSSSSGNVS
jgi:hypothetical protein